MLVNVCLTLCAPRKLETFYPVVSALSEGALVNYVVPGALPPTTHSDDAALMRFRAFT